MDDPSLMVSAMRSAVAKCHVGLGRMERAEARAAEWAAEKERLQSEKEDLRRALETKGGLLSEEVGRNACLAAISLRLRSRRRG
ncbi:hypothetical protein AAC387_Pa10g1214 [Persea americana]